MHDEEPTRPTTTAMNVAQRRQPVCLAAVDIDGLAELSKARAFAPHPANIRLSTRVSRIK